jgi:hypothetical protein
MPPLLPEPVVPGLLLLPPLSPAPGASVTAARPALLVASCDILLPLSVLLGLLLLPEPPALAEAAVLLPSTPAPAAPLLNGLAERCCCCCASCCPSGKLLLRAALIPAASTALPPAAGMDGTAVMLLLLCLPRGLLGCWLGEPLPPEPGVLLGEPARPLVRLAGCSDASMLLNDAAWGRQEQAWWCQRADHRRCTDFGTQIGLMTPTHSCRQSWFTGHSCCTTINLRRSHA